MSRWAGAGSPIRQPSKPSAKYAAEGPGADTLARLFTVDASVFLNAFHPSESGSEESRRLLEELRERSAPLLEPALLLPEIAAAVRRGTQDATLARQFASALSDLPALVLVPLDQTLAREAAGLAADFSLRGSDAVYGAVALRFGAELVSLDQEQSRRLASVITTRAPAEVSLEDA